MSEPTKDSKKQGLEKHASSAKGKFIAVGLMFVVACSFSYAVGTQQQGTNQISSGFAGTSVNEQYEQSNTQAGANDGLEGQSLSANEQYGQDSFEYGDQVGHRRHGGRGHGHNMIQQGNSTVSQNYSADTQRCCATGKTGTCHS